MLLTLTLTSSRPLLDSKNGTPTPIGLLDLPAFARERLGVHGLNLTTDLLTGLSREKLEAVRERADKAGCACLLLIDPEPLALGDAAEATVKAAIDRLRRVIRAAQVLGCNAAAVTPGGPDEPDYVQRTVDRFKLVVDRSEKLDLNVLISPGQPVAAKPERVTDLIKRIGGFRIGTFPDFEAAAATADAVGYLRRLAPYASAVSATTQGFVNAETGRAPKPDSAEPLRHSTYDLKPLIDALVSVGYDGTLAVDYRGAGEATLGIVRSRRALETLLDQEPEES